MAKRTKTSKMRRQIIRNLNQKIEALTRDIRELKEEKTCADSSSS